MPMKRRAKCDTSSFILSGEIHIHSRGLMRFTVMPYRTLFTSKRSNICNRCFPGPTRVLDTNSISIASAVFAGLTRWQTDW